MDFEDDFVPPDIDPDDEDQYLNENFDVPDGR